MPAADALPAAIARWVLGGVVYGLAAAGLYSQGRELESRHAERSRSIS
jgi:hypothetical protein